MKLWFLGASCALAMGCARGANAATYISNVTYDTSSITSPNSGVGGIVTLEALASPLFAGDDYMEIVTFTDPITNAIHPGQQHAWMSNSYRVDHISGPFGSVVYTDSPVTDAGGNLLGLAIDVFDAGGAPGNPPYFVAQQDYIFSEQSVPEPATWIELLAGFALIGGALRSVSKARPSTYLVSAAAGSIEAR